MRGSALATLSSRSWSPARGAGSALCTAGLFSDRQLGRTDLGDMAFQPERYSRQLLRDRRDDAVGRRLSQELLPDQARVLGPSHPRTLTIHHNIAFFTDVLRVSETCL